MSDFRVPAYISVKACQLEKQELISEFVTFFKELIEYSNAKHTKSEILAHFKGSIVLKTKELEKWEAKLK